MSQSIFSVIYYGFSVTAGGNNLRVKKNWPIRLVLLVRRTTDFMHPPYSVLWLRDTEIGSNYLYISSISSIWVETCFLWYDHLSFLPLLSSYFSHTPSSWPIGVSSIWWWLLSVKSLGPLCSELSATLLFLFLILTTSTLGFSNSYCLICKWILAPGVFTGEWEGDTRLNGRVTL